MKKLMNSKSVMITSIISLCLSIIVLAAASMAWLSMNKETKSDGMQLKVNVTPNLIIDDSSSDIIAVTSPSESNFSVSFTDSGAVAKEPATHNGSSATQLSYVTNADSVSPTTGLVKSGATLTMSDATAARHYVDFTVYIACTETEMASQNLKATLTPAASIVSSSASKEDTLKAASIDFIVNGSYIGTLNVAEFDASANDYTTEKTEVLLYTGNIPHNQATEGAKYITVIMRCYIDGALLKSAGQAFINTATVDTGDITLNVTFTATDAS